MPIPVPEIGLVICYSYLWHEEIEAGRQEGVKNRPAVIVLAVEQADGETQVTVLPVTHSSPREAGAAVEIPAAVKKYLGLDDQRSWVVVSEGNEFVWPGYDLQKIPGSQEYQFGVLPPRFFLQVIGAFRAWHASGKGKIGERD